ncbi:UNVERIFIED_CONTAM: Copia protein, partial [Sesamum radiatum]
IGADGEVTTFKARLVAKGYTQRSGVYFEETFLPVAMAKSIRIMLAIAAWYDYEKWQMDVKTACLNSFVEEEIYMDQPEGFTVVGEKQKVCHLQRSIYGLKQASRSWNIRFDEVIWVMISLKMTLTLVYTRRMLGIPYASAVGNIQYAEQCTRPDIAYALSVTSRYQACAGEAHWTVVKTILKYLRRTKDVSLVYGQWRVNTGRL